MNNSNEEQTTQSKAVYLKCPKGHEVWKIPEHVGTGYVCEICDMIYYESELIYHNVKS